MLFYCVPPSTRVNQNGEGQPRGLTVGYSGSRYTIIPYRNCCRSFGFCGGSSRDERRTARGYSRCQSVAFGSSCHYRHQCDRVFTVTSAGSINGCSGSRYLERRKFTVSCRGAFLAKMGFRQAKEVLFQLPPQANPLERYIDNSVLYFLYRCSSGQPVCRGFV